MLRNLVTEEDLKGYTPKLSELLWTGEVDYSAQKEKATQFVFNQLIQKRYDVKELMPELTLRANGVSLSANETGTGYCDTINRLRLVIDNISNTVSSKVLTLQGSDNGSDNFKDITTITIATTDTIKTVTFHDTYKYYRINSAVVSGVFDFRAYLTETVYDELFECKWLVYIFQDMRVSAEDQFDLKMNFYEDMYKELMSKAIIYIDSDSDGVPEYTTGIASITLSR